MKRLVVAAALLVVAVAAQADVVWSETETGTVKGNFIIWSATSQVSLTVEISHKDGSDFEWDYLPNSNWYGDEDGQFAQLFMQAGKEVSLNMNWSGISSFMEAGFDLWDGQITGAAADAIVDDVLDYSGSGSASYSLLYSGSTLTVNGDDIAVDNDYFDLIGQVTGWGGDSSLDTKKVAIGARLNFEPSPAAAVPAPGAILMASMGVSLVGWLRRRKSL